MKLLTVILSMVVLASCKQSQVKVAQLEKHLPFYNSAGFAPEWIEPSSAQYASIHTIPSFKFINQEGDTITQQSFSNKIYVADFFFTTCPGICKKLTNNLSIVQNAFANDNGVLLLSHSVTPDTDSVAKLQAYAKRFGVTSGKWHLVTGNRNSIYTIARQSYFADEDMGEVKDANDFLHTENVLLIDKHRRIRGVYKGTSETAMQDLIADINTLKKEE